MKQTTKVEKRRQLDPMKTRESILAAAFEAFAQNGYEGASIGDIANAAGVNKSLVQYHFGAKEELWSACLADCVTPMLNAVDRFLDSEDANPAELIIARFQFLKDHPEIRRLLFWVGMASTPMPSFVRERREKVIAKFGGDTSSPQFARFLAALAATDGWFLFRNFYQGPFSEIVFDEAMEQRLLNVFLEMVKDK